jgi:hypothetical protein
VREKRRKKKFSFVFFPVGLRSAVGPPVAAGGEKNNNNNLFLFL